LPVLVIVSSLFL